MNAQVQPQATATTCIVGCKLPHGLVLTRRDRKGNPIGDSFTVKGMNAKHIIGGYALTDNVPTEFMENWLKENKDHAAVKAGTIFMHGSLADARAHAKDGRDVKTGLEALDPIEHAKKFKLEPDEENLKAYRQQIATNPDRNRQTVE